MQQLMLAKKMAVCVCMQPFDLGPSFSPVTFRKVELVRRIHVSLACSRGILFTEQQSSLWLHTWSKSTTSSRELRTISYHGSPKTDNRRFSCTAVWVAWQALYCFRFCITLSLDDRSRTHGPMPPLGWQRSSILNLIWTSHLLIFLQTRTR